MKKVFVLGGTGQLGVYTIRELVNQGYEVHTVALPPAPPEGLLPEGVECELVDFFTLSDAEIIDRLQDTYAFVYAGGVDERIVPDAPALAFYYKENVLPTQRIARLAAEAGVQKFVLFGSYFSHFTEKLDAQLDMKNEPYTNTRLLQEQVAFAEGEGKMDVMVLRLPYIFGTVPNREPVWKMMTDLVKDQDTYAVAVGGTAAVTVEQVAQATLGAIKNGKHRGAYFFSGLDLDYKTFYTMIVEALGQTGKTALQMVPFAYMKDAVEALNEQVLASGKQHGIRIPLSVELQSLELYTENDDVNKLLEINDEDVLQSIKETLDVCVAYYNA